ncbi:MAG: hypothetical protein JHD16_00035 [Solirubrobacteraceae bacterium]|nr:hypothetical protein [Solirubrobacteraceae bacterium]
MRAFTPAEARAYRHVAARFREGAGRIPAGAMSEAMRTRADYIDAAVSLLPTEEKNRRMIDPDEPAGTLNGHISTTPIELTGGDSNDPSALRTIAHAISELAETGESLRDAGWDVHVDTIISTPSIHFTIALERFADAQAAANASGVEIPLLWAGEDASAGVVVAHRDDLTAWWPGDPLVVSDLLAGSQTTAKDLADAATQVMASLASHEQAIRGIGELDHDAAESIERWRAELADDHVRDWYGLHVTVDDAPAIIKVTSTATARARGYRAAREGRPDRTEEDGLLGIAFREGIDEAGLEPLGG